MTLQTLGETLETDLTACVPELETVKSSLTCIVHLLVAFPAIFM